MSFKKTKLYRLFNVLDKVSEENRPRIIYITNNQILRCNNGKLEFCEFTKPHGIIKDLSLDRNSVLGLFSKIEFMVNEILFYAIRPKAEDRLNETIDYLDLFTKIKLLKNWNIIDKNIKKYLICLKEVRNGFAHNWSERDIKYKDKNINDNFSNFRKDLLEVWLSLIKLLQDNMPEINEVLKKYKKIT